MHQSVCVCVCVCVCTHCKGLVLSPIWLTEQNRTFFQERRYSHSTFVVYDFSRRCPTSFGKSSSGSIKLKPQIASSVNVDEPQLQTIQVTGAVMSLWQIKWHASFHSRTFQAKRFSLLTACPLLCPLCEESSNVFHAIKCFGEFSLLELKVLTTFPRSLACFIESIHYCLACCAWLWSACTGHYDFHI